MNRLRVAIIGLGIGQAHLRAFQALPERFEVRAICSIDEVANQRIATQFGVPGVYNNLEALCQDPAVDVVDICTPSHLHASQTRQALLAGKHVICEKPVAGSLAELDDLQMLAAKTRLRVMPIFQYRFGHGLLKLKRLVELGIAGQPYLATVEVAWRRRADYYLVPWRGRLATELGGALITHAIHALDLLCYILGMVKNVSTFASTRVNPVEGEDCVVAALEMSNGALASLAVTLGSAVEISRHRFCFANLTAESNTRPYANSSDPWIFVADDPDRMDKIEAALAGFQPELEYYEGQFARFHQAMVAGGPPPVSLQDARRVLEVITAMYCSVKSGSKVSLPIPESHPGYRGWLNPGTNS